MADDVCQGADGAFDAMGPEAFPCFEPARPPRLPRLQCSCSLSIMVLVLTPTVCVMVAVALIAWFMIHNTASNAVEVIGHEGQRSFVVAMRFSILAYTATVQRINSVNRPRWENTTCDGAPTVPNASAFDAYDDVRLALWSQLFYIKGSSSLAGVGFPCGSVLAYQLTSTGSRWIVVDKSTDFWVWMVNSTTWKEDWANGTGIYSKPDDLIEADLPYNISARVWFTDAVKNGRQSWSAIFYSLPMGGLSLPAVMPIYHPNGALKLVSQAEISLKELDSFFTGLLLTPNTFAFIAELDGSLVASVPAGLSTALPSQQSATGAIMTRVISQEAGDARIAGAAAWLVAQYGSLAAVPVNDSGFVVPLVGRSHYLFSGHIQDEYGLHWVIVIGLPRSDLLQGLDDTTLQAILIITGVLLASMLLIGAVTVTVRRNLQLFAKRIKLMGTMDLDGAEQLEKAIFLSEPRLILLNLRESIANLQQFRTFLPLTMLDKMRQAERPEGEDPDGPPPRLGQPQSPTVLQAARSPLQSELTHSTHPLLTVGSTSLENSQPSFPLRDSSSSYSARYQHSQPASLVHTMLERRMEFLSITLMCLELAHLHGVLPTSCCPSDFLLWYEACLSTALNLLQKWHGDFYRLVGDQLLFSWGAVRQSAGQCNKACHAAWHLSQALREIDAQATHQVQYVPRVSVVTGTALCGVMGTDTTRDTYLIGPLVKLGVRLASLNGPYDTHILVDVGVAKQCETLFQMQVCGLIHGIAVADPRPVQPVFELVSPAPEDGELPRSTAEEEWMYRLAAAEGSRSGYELAMDALRRGLVSQAKQSLEDFLALKPDDRHARRMLERIHSQSVDSTGLDGIVD
eukprot:GGOE01009310.1.p1 GENE.GGOE01009310.1~~GGOE01009310.1.p1  ORF type:complete len:869 (-),score=242.32 GGOE01009310.1:429-2990(-)